MANKRRGYLDWDETFMHIAYVISQRSKDPVTQAGAVLVNDSNVVVGLGYNGFPRGCSDDELPWAREGDFCDCKYAYVVHAEENAVYNANHSVRGCRIYCTLFPCNECVKTLIQTGIKEVVYQSDKYHHLDVWRVARRMLELAKIPCRQYQPKTKIEIK